jgi:creatinine amidohydrolase/Fe(II)-dependent formamide hydrolase-like protein
MRLAFATIGLGLIVPSLALAQAPPTVVLEDLTWTEVREAVRAGWTTIILPTGGTEQNGPHMALGKHNYVVRYAAEQIARRLGRTLVAPVLAYVPEGDVDPPSGHMRFPGTITLPPEHYAKVLEYAARSMRAGGFRDIVLIGDSGGNQAGQRAVAHLLNRQWAGSGIRVHHVPDYYAAGHDPNGPFARWLRSQGFTADDIGRHAGMADTSLLMAVEPGLVRGDRAALGDPASGVHGNPARASIAHGRKGLDLKVDAAVAQIRSLMGAR